MGKEDHMDSITIQKQVDRFNGKFGGLLLRCDYRYPFAISYEMLEMIEKEKNAWGSIFELSNYVQSQCEFLGYTPWKLSYDSFDPKGEEGGTHKFSMWCEDRRK